MLPEERRERRELVVEKAFVAHARTFVVINAFLVGIWVLAGGGTFWPVWVIMGWGLALVLHGMATFGRTRRY